MKFGTLPFETVLNRAEKFQGDLTILSKNNNNVNIINSKLTNQFFLGQLSNDSLSLDVEVVTSQTWLRL